MNDEMRPLLLEGTRQLGLELSPEQVGQFERLLSLLLEVNTRHNLTALRTERDVVLKHFVDSLSLLSGDYLGGAQRVLDLGTGAGFPALPLAIMRPELALIPLDSIRKKIAFVEQAAQELGLDQVTPRVGRAETLAREPDQRGQYGRVVARAVASLPELVELSLPLLRQGGQLVAQKGDITEEELVAGRRAAQEVGGEVSAVVPFKLPILGDGRTLVVVTKTRPTPDRYPRREGVPHAQPLFWKAK